MTPTPHRTFRIPDDIYDPAQQRAEREGTTVTAVVQECLRRYGDAASAGQIDDLVRQGGA